MASSSSYSEDLTCSICLNIFTDPATLSCGHSFCRECIKVSLTSLNQCPQCWATISSSRMDFPTNYILKSLAEKAKEAKHSKAAVGFCPEHDEKLKLFCINDQQLICIICRDCEKHEGHKFKPVKEAAESFRKELEALLKKDSCGISEIERLAKSQIKEIGKTKEKSQKLKMQIRNQFQEMQKFLKRREHEIMKELKEKENDELEKMGERLNVVERTLSEGRESEEKIKSVLEITDPESFLKSWSENKRNTAPKPRLDPKASDLQVVKSSLSLGHYETHLQFFVWKEMLQVVKPQAEKISSERQDPPDWSLSLLSQWQNYKELQNTSTFTINEITSGPHYWEIDVEDKNSFTVQIQNETLTYKDNKYTITCNYFTRELKFESKLKKIGLYLKSSSEELQFFDAETMKQVQATTLNQCLRGKRARTSSSSDDDDDDWVGMTLNRPFSLKKSL